MKTLSELQKVADEALAQISQDPHVLQSEVFVSANEQLIGRVDFKSDIPCAGLQEPKSQMDYGIGIRVLFKGEDGQQLFGFGSEPNDLSSAGVQRAFAKARAGAVQDPFFITLPAPAKRPPTLSHYADPSVMEISESDFVNLAWDAVAGALEVFKYAEQKNSLVVGGDVTILKERMAIANSLGLRDADESSVILENITTMIENANVKGTGWNIDTHLTQFPKFAAGSEAAQAALSCLGGKRIDSGSYHVVFGPQATTELLVHLLIPALKLSAVDTGASWCCGKLGQQVCHEQLSIYDDGSVAGLPGSKRITCEGIPTGRTDLIRDGILVGFLANHYYAHKCSNKFRRFIPRSGFRFHGYGRNFDTIPGISATNLIIQGRHEKCISEIERQIGNGLYIGRIWYCYPVNGLAAGDFTCTIVGDSYIIKNGRRVEAIQPNTLRINDNIHRILWNISDISNLRRPTITWAGEEVLFTPCIAVRDVQLESISRFMANIPA